MSRSTYEEVERKVRETGSFTSGDCAFTDIIWDKMRILPTDPGQPCMLVLGGSQELLLWTGRSMGVQQKVLTRW